MKYFIQNSGFLNGTGKARELSKDDALGWYKLHAMPGYANLKAVPNFHKGIKILYQRKNIWGENISDKECFKRKLNGTLR